ncbi:hypothetical protein CHUAL_012913 [Chamberlinius hualienensis]
MWLTRIIKKKWLISFLLVAIVVYCALCLIKQFKENKSVEAVEESSSRQTQRFKWYTEDNDTNVQSLNCRNSVQGKIIIADDRGYLCRREEILLSGCCNIESQSTKRYTCEYCKSNHCCGIYEYCISCCMNPEKKTILQQSLTKVLDRFKVLYGSVNDQFELCLVKCRTSSQSVLHENTYRDSRNKHCFGEHAPSVHASG